MASVSKQDALELPHVPLSYHESPLPERTGLTPTRRQAMSFETKKRALEGAKLVPYQSARHTACKVMCS